MEAFPGSPAAGAQNGPVLLPSVRPRERQGTALMKDVEDLPLVRPVQCALAEAGCEDTPFSASKAAILTDALAARLGRKSGHQLMSPIA